jgi:predicted RNase H-like nuclease (RuvC/YqgF family)
MAVDAVEVTESLPKETGLVGLDGPLDELDLTKMLVENFEDNGPEETSPSGDAVEEAEPVEESTEEAGDTEHVLSQEESETESDAEAEPEQAEPEGEQDEPEWLQRRIDRFTRKLRLAEEERDELEKEVTQLRSQVDQVPAAVQQNGNPVAHIKKESELNKIAELAERRLQFAEDMEDALLDNPERVEKVLRQQGVELADGYYPNIAPLFLQNHPDANRLAELDFVAGELEFAGVLIDAKHCDVV